MAYSSIKKKNCKCSEYCKLFPTIGCMGYNFAHVPQELKDRYPEKFKKKSVRLRTQSEKTKLSRKLHSVNNKVLTEEGKRKLQLFQWYYDGMTISEPICENCGAFKPELKRSAYLNKQWHSCQAHLFPKKLFTSIESHPLNRMVLGSGYSGLCWCHDNYDNKGWEYVSTMKIWPEVVRRFKVLYPFISINEHKYIPEILSNQL